MTKAIIVSPEEYFGFFQQAFPEWEIQHPVLDINQMWNELGNGELDVNSEIVILNDTYYSEESENLELAITTLSEEALVLIIADPEYQQAITNRIANMVQRDYLPVSRFWFVGRDNPIQDVTSALAEYETYKPIREQEKAIRNATVAPVSQEPQIPYSSISGEPQQPAQQAAQQNNGGDYAGDGYQGPARNGMVIASTSSKGGSGKSTVALCSASMLYHASRLAFEAGQAPRPLDVVVIDMDTRDGQIGFFLSESTPTVLNIFTSQDFSRNNIRKNLVYNERLGIHALLAPKRARTADYTTPELYNDLIAKLRTMFDIVMLDTSVNYLDPLISDVVLPVADAVLFVTNMSRGSVFGMTRWIAEVTLPKDQGGSAAINKDKIGVVVNQSMGNVGFDQSKLVEAASDVPLLVSIPMDSGAVLAATNNNHLDDIILRHPNISPAYFDLASRIIQGNFPLMAPNVDGGNSGGTSVAPGSPPPLPPKKKRWGSK